MKQETKEKIKEGVKKWIPKILNVAYTATVAVIAVICLLAVWFKG